MIKTKPSPRFLHFPNPYNCDVIIRFSCDSYSVVEQLTDYITKITESVKVTESRTHIVTVNHYKTIDVEVTVQGKLKWRKDIDDYRKQVEDYSNMLLPFERRKELGIYCYEIEVG